MNLKEILALVKCSGRLLAAVATANTEALANVEKDVNAVHAGIDARKGIVR